MTILHVLDLIGTSAFAISGAFVGIKNKLDLFGVFVLAIFTASGGGLVRDVIIGNETPVFFSEPKYLVCIILSTIAACIAYRFIKKIFLGVKLFDAMGLGVFTVLAAYKGILVNMPVIGIVFIAVVTGIGGGIIRDILVSNVPMVFKSEIYALAAIIGALSFYHLYKLIPFEINLYLCIFIVFITRTVSIYFNLNLPVIKTVNNDMKV